jgi:hypothetical protein
MKEQAYGRNIMVGPLRKVPVEMKKIQCPFVKLMLNSRMKSPTLVFISLLYYMKLLMSCRQIFLMRNWEKRNYARSISKKTRRGLD